MSIEFELHGERVRVAPIYLGDEFDLDVNGRRVRARQTPLGQTAFLFELDGKQREIQVARHGDEIFIHLDGRAWRVSAVDPLSDRRGVPGGVAHPQEVRAPMPGIVVNIAKGVGDRVQSGDAILTIESMKLQMAVKATGDGTIAEILFDEGAMFPKDAVLVRIEAAD